MSQIPMFMDWVPMLDKDVHQEGIESLIKPSITQQNIRGLDKHLLFLTHILDEVQLISKVESYFEVIEREMKNGDFEKAWEYSDCVQYLVDQCSEIGVPKEYLLNEERQRYLQLVMKANECPVLAFEPDIIKKGLFEKQLKLNWGFGWDNIPEALVELAKKKKLFQRTGISITSSLHPKKRYHEFDLYVPSYHTSTTYFPIKLIPISVQFNFSIHMNYSPFFSYSHKWEF